MDLKVSLVFQLTTWDSTRFYFLNMDNLKYIYIKFEVCIRSSEYFIWIKMLPRVSYSPNHLHFINSYYIRFVQASKEGLQCY
jgi:hypothetical protein